MFDKALERSVCATCVTDWEADSAKDLGLQNASLGAS